MGLSVPGPNSCNKMAFAARQLSFFNSSSPQLCQASSYFVIVFYIYFLVFFPFFVFGGERRRSVWKTAAGNPWVFFFYLFFK